MPVLAPGPGGGAALSGLGAGPGGGAALWVAGAGPGGGAALWVVGAGPGGDPALWVAGAGPGGGPALWVVGAGPGGGPGLCGSALAIPADPPHAARTSVAAKIAVFFDPIGKHFQSAAVRGLFKCLSPRRLQLNVSIGSA
jgi:hypothetical protein